MSATPIRVIVADDQRIAREAIIHHLAAESGFEVVSEAEDGNQAVDLAQQLQPDLVLMDVGMPADGIRATQRIVATCPETKVIGLSLHPSEVMAERMLDAGAVAYLEKSIPRETLAAAVRAVATGECGIGNLLRRTRQGPW